MSQGSAPGDHGALTCIVPSGTYCVVSYSFHINGLGNPTVI